MVRPGGKRWKRRSKKKPTKYSSKKGREHLEEKEKRARLENLAEQREQISERGRLQKISELTNRLPHISTMNKRELEKARRQFIADRRIPIEIRDILKKMTTEEFRPWWIQHTHNRIRRLKELNN
ncbi:MAG: hypothetical protein Q8P05_03760 [Candidatus Diapherotrites archaeon]|nr:hypothetical protein [Candidatus Diapherotrites archaeon]MDZ4256926.1 hypothetical protein [archaeon]